MTPVATGARIVTYIPNNAYLVWKFEEHFVSEVTGDAPLSVGRLTRVQIDSREASRRVPHRKAVNQMSARLRPKVAISSTIQMVRPYGKRRDIALIDQLKLEPVYRRGRC